MSNDEPIIAVPTRPRSGALAHDQVRRGAASALAVLAAKRMSVMSADSRSRASAPVVKREGPNIHIQPSVLNTEQAPTMLYGAMRSVNRWGLQPEALSLIHRNLHQSLGMNLPGATGTRDASPTYVTQVPEPRPRPLQPPVQHVKKEAYRREVAGLPEKVGYNPLKLYATMMARPVVDYDEQNKFLDRRVVEIRKAKKVRQKIEVRARYLEQRLVDGLAKATGDQVRNDPWGAEFGVGVTFLRFLAQHSPFPHLEVNIAETVVFGGQLETYVSLHTSADGSVVRQRLTSFDNASDWMRGVLKAHAKRAKKSKDDRHNIGTQFPIAVVKVPNLGRPGSKIEQLLFTIEEVDTFFRRSDKGTSIPTVCQRYVRCKGGAARVLRLIRLPPDPEKQLSSVSYLIGTTQLFTPKPPKTLQEKKIPPPCFISDVTHDNASKSIVNKVRNSLLPIPMAMADSVVYVLEKFFPVEIKHVVCDFIQDRSGEWWMTQVFSISSRRRAGRRPTESELGEEEEEKKRLAEVLQEETKDDEAEFDPLAPTGLVKQHLAPSLKSTMQHCAGHYCTGSYEEGPGALLVPEDMIGMAAQYILLDQDCRRGGKLSEAMAAFHGRGPVMYKMVLVCCLCHAVYLAPERREMLRTWQDLARNASYPQTPSRQCPVFAQTNNLKPARPLSAPPSKSSAVAPKASSPNLHYAPKERSPSRRVSTAFASILGSVGSPDRSTELIYESDTEASNPALPSSARSASPPASMSPSVRHKRGTIHSTRATAALPAAFHEAVVEDELSSLALLRANSCESNPLHGITALETGFRGMSGPAVSIEISPYSKMAQPKEYTTKPRLKKRPAWVAPVIATLGHPI